MALTPEDIAYGLSHGAPVRWRLTSVDRRGNPVELGGTGSPDLTSALLYERGGNPGLEGGSLSMDHGREVVTEASLRLLLDRVPGGLDALDHLRLTEVRRIQPRGGRELRYRTALDRALTLGLDGLWALSEATDDAIDLSGHGNDGTVQYAEGQRAVLPPLYDRGLGSMRFLRGLEQTQGNCVFGHGTPMTGYFINGGTATPDTFPDGPLASFGVTSGTVIEGTSTVSTSIFPTGPASAPVTDGDDVVVAVVARRRTASSPNIGTSMQARGVDAGDTPTATAAITPVISLPADGNWYVYLCSLSASFASITSVKLGIGLLTARDTPVIGSEVEVAYMGVIPGVDVTFPNVHSAGTGPYTGKTRTYLFEQFDLDKHLPWLVAGNMGTGFSWAGTPHASASERVATMVTIPTDAEVENIWSAGGTVAGIFRWADGGLPFPRIITKGWFLYFDRTNRRLGFRALFDGTNGEWITQDNIVDADTDVIWTVEYDSSSVSNDPVIRVYDRAADEEIAVTLTETSTPSGTAISDASNDLIIGNRSDGEAAFNGILALAFLARRVLADEEIDELFALTHEAAQYLGPSPEPEDVEFSQGIFRPSFSDTLFAWDGRPVVGLTLHDNTVHLLDTTGVALSYPAGTGYWAVLRDILETHLGLLTDLPPGDGPPLPQDFSRPASWRWIDVLRDLTDGRNRYPVWPDLLGRMTTRERINPASEQPAVHYAETLEPRMLDAGAPYVRKGNVPLKDNRRVAVAGFGATHITPQYVIYENADPGSPVSTAHTPPRLDRLRDDSRPSTRAVFDLATLRALAQYELRSLAAEAQPVTFDTFPDPRRQPRESYLVTVVGAETAQLVRVQRWSRALKAGAPMTHEADIVRPVTLTELFEIEEEA